MRGLTRNQQRKANAQARAAYLASQGKGHQGRYEAINAARAEARAEASVRRQQERVEEALRKLSSNSSVNEPINLWGTTFEGGRSRNLVFREGYSRIEGKILEGETLTQEERDWMNRNIESDEINEMFSRGPERVADAVYDTRGFGGIEVV